MAKELPYFRFTISEWLNDDISMEDYKTKGVFADVCAFYWFRDCIVDIALLDRRFSDALTTIQSLVELDIIKYNNKGKVSIKFLDNQFDLLSEKRKKYVEAGKKGGLKKSSNAKASLKHRSSYKDKDKDNDKDNDNDKEYQFNLFWDLYDKKIDRNKCFSKWNKLKESEKSKIIIYIPKYKESITEKKYMKHPATFLTNRSWENEIIEPNKEELSSAQKLILISAKNGN